MADKKTTLIQSSRGSVFSVFGEEELNQITEEGKRKVAVSGKINEPGIIEVPENATLNDIIDICGGILDKKKFKAAQLGIPFGGFLTEDSLDKVLDFDLFDKNSSRNIIILSEDDCIVQYATFYVDYLIGRIEDSNKSEIYKKYSEVKEEVYRIWRVLDRISKGRSNMRDVYLLRRLSGEIKDKLNQEHNIIQEIIGNRRTYRRKHM